MNSNEFAQYLNSTIISGVASKDELYKKTKELIEKANAIMPKTLYKFRECNERHIDAFDCDQIWLSTADCMNDGFDTRLYMDKKEVEEKLDSFISTGVNKEQYQNSLDTLIHYYPDAEDTIKMALPFGVDSLKSFLERNKSTIKTGITSLFSTIPSIAQTTMSICSFCESVLSPYMWGLYSVDEKGFALEYAVEDLKQARKVEKEPAHSELYPVVYNSKRYRVPTDYIIYLLLHRLLYEALTRSGAFQLNMGASEMLMDRLYPCPDILMPLKVSLHKSDYWEKEKEWRLFHYFNNKGEQSGIHDFLIVQPKSVYIGRRTSSINEKILKALAVEKNIPVYKMVLDDNSASYDLKADRIV